MQWQLRQPGPLLPHVAAWFCVCIALAGCTAEDPELNLGQTSEVGPRSEAREGPVTLTVTTDRDSVVVGDKITLTISAIYPQGFDVDVPHFEDEVGEFAVRSAETPPDIPVDDTRRLTHRYVLDTFATGEIEIPAITITAQGPSEDDQPVELESEPLVITVQSVGATEDQQPRDIRAEVELPIERASTVNTLIAIAAGTLILAAALLALFYWRRLRRPTSAERRASADAWAHHQLDLLEQAQLPQQQLYHEFYYRLSDIVRQYIERRFHLAAPEQTTDEFLRELRSHSVLDVGHKLLLEQFLRAADMVKFALREPTVDECNDAFQAARDFVTQTAGQQSATNRDGHSSETAEVTE